MGLHLTRRARVPTVIWHQIGLIGTLFSSISRRISGHNTAKNEDDSASLRCIGDRMDCKSSSNATGKEHSRNWRPTDSSEFENRRDAVRWSERYARFKPTENWNSYLDLPRTSSDFSRLLRTNCRIIYEKCDVF